MIHVEGAEAYWVFFKYERLPSFCYRCGILGHQDRECRKVHKGCLSMDEGELQYDPWMRVVAPKTTQRKGSPSPSKFSKDDAQGSDGNKVIARQPIIHLQPSTASMTIRTDMEAVLDSSLFPKSNPPNNSRISDLEITNPLNEAFSVTQDLACGDFRTRLFDEIPSSNPTLTHKQEQASNKETNRISVIEGNILVDTDRKISKEENLGFVW